MSENSITGITEENPELFEFIDRKINETNALRKVLKSLEKKHTAQDSDPPEDGGIIAGNPCSKKTEP